MSRDDKDVIIVDAVIETLTDVGYIVFGPGTSTEELIDELDIVGVAHDADAGTISDTIALLEEMRADLLKEETNQPVDKPQEGGLV